MVVLGIDPGTRGMGFGLVTKKGGGIALLSAGVVRVRGRGDAEMLGEIRARLKSLIARFNPSVFAIEKLYFVKNRKTGIEVAQARGVALLIAGECGLKVREFGPSEVKVGLTSYGRADKAAVAKMVRLTLHAPTLKVPDDATDALALAILACGELP